MLIYCKSLKTLPDIYKCPTKNVTNMSHIYNHCKSLESIPENSNWNS